jgi:hypothetical protein
MPSETGDISTALKWAQEHQVDIAVKCGGHSVSGTSSSHGGLVIDLSRMNKATVDLVNKTVTAQGGATWKEVDESAGEHGLATVGGTVNHTGIGGLTLGGGYGWLSGQYGLTIDNLLSATVALADGRILTASSTENSDLFWGLRGAGYNFGVVVDFTYKAYDQRSPVFAGLASFTPDKLERVIEELNACLLSSDPRSGAICIFAQPPGAPVPMVNVIVYYNGSHEEGSQHFSSLLALEPVMNTISMMPYHQLNSLQNPMATYGDRKSFKGVFYRPPLDPGFARTIMADFTAKVQEDPDLLASGLLIEFFDMRKVCEVPQSDTAFASRSATQNGNIALRWTDPAKDGQHRAWAREVQARWKAELDSKASDTEEDVPQYINYAEREFAHSAHLYMLTLSSRRFRRRKHLRREPRALARAESEI